VAASTERIRLPDYPHQREGECRGRCDYWSPSDLEDRGKEESALDMMEAEEDELASLAMKKGGWAGDERGGWIVG